MTRRRRFGTLTPSEPPSASGSTLAMTGAGPESLERGLEGMVLAGRFRVDKRIGAGGMGEVYRGHHLALDIPIAIKVMYIEVAAQPVLAERFAREARATSRLQHRNIVRVLDYGTEEALSFIVMELLHGESLAQRIAAHGPPPLEAVKAVMTQVCDALEVAHAAGIVHRDLKPENIFLTREGEEPDVLKVLDFGLARMLDPKATKLTQTGEIAGTPQYMSPEQCRSLDVGAATDIYALGCILTELLQGRPPFDGVSSVDVIAKHLFLPVPPLARDATLERVPVALNALREEMLAKTPEQRPRTVREAKERLLAAFASKDPARARADVASDRDGRIPSWNPPAMPKAETPTVPAGTVSVGLVPLGGSAVAALSDSLRVSLAMRRIEWRTEEGAPLDEAQCVLLDVGSEIEKAEAWLASPEKRKARPVVVCCSVTGIEALRRLIAAGANEVQSYPVSLEALMKRIERTALRARRST